MKLRAQAQHFQPGDIIGSGEIVKYVTINSTKWANNKVQVVLSTPYGFTRAALWGKYTYVNVLRATADTKCPS